MKKGVKKKAVKAVPKKKKDLGNLGPYPVLENNPGKWTNRLVIGTPTLGTVRMEWTQARFGQTIPTNFSLVDVHQFMHSYAPLGYQIADAENLTAKVVVEGNFEWFLSWEDDNLPPLDALVKINEYMITKKAPIVAGVYFTKSEPPEPIIYRGQGVGYYADWKLGEKIWVDGVPFGFTLIHGDIIRALWEESEEYIVNGTVTRRVFDAPSESYIDPLTGGWMNSAGTSDLAWCKRMMTDNIFVKAGWPEFQKKKYPYLVDTSIFVKHIDRNTGTIYPVKLPEKFLKGEITFKDALDIMIS